MDIRNVIRVALALSAAATLGAACGVANPFAPAAAASSRQDQLLKFTQCMRQHGVDVPDPVNGRIEISRSAAPQASPSASGPEQTDSQFQAAQNACKRYLPNGGNGSGQPTQQQIDQATKFAQCMRDHGVPMQDPSVQGGGLRFGGSSGVDPSSPQFQQAQQACQKYAPGGGKVTTSGGGGSGTQATGGGNG